MKKFIYTLILGYLAFSLTGCDQDIDHPYTGKDRIQFKCFTFNDKTQVRTYSDSLTFSFGLIADSITIDTAKVVVEYMGKTSDRERIYYVSVVTDSTTAVAGVHYDAIKREQKFRPKKLTDTLKIAIHRENLSDDYSKKENIRLDLQLEASEDFDLGLEKGLKKKIKLNNYLSEPTWWEKNYYGFLGFYHPKKWKILMSFNDKFTNQTYCPYTYNNDGRTFVDGLTNYLEKVPTYDDNTGYRIYINKLEAPDKE
ncbi:MAG: DUF4843 domain-containing protein [Odoribacter sp.]